MTVEQLSLAELQEKLQGAQRDRQEVRAMRPKTESLARRAADLIAENHFAERVRRSWS